MIKLLLLAIVPFMTEHRNVAPKTEVSTNFYGSVTGIVDNAYIQAHGGGGVDTNAVRDIASEEIVPATNILNQALSDALDDKRDKDDLAVYEVVRTENTDWTLTTNVVDRLATTNGVNAAMTNRYTKSETDAKLAGKLDSRAAERGSIRWNVSQDDTADLNVSAISANFDGEIFVAGDSAFNGRVNCTYGWEGFESNGEILPVYLDSLEWRTTGNRSLADYGITDATPLSMISETDPYFSNAVLAVGLNIDTNSVAVLNEIAATFGGFPIEGTATTVGGLLAALAAAIAWLKKNKIGSFASVGGSSATVENGVAKLDDFFTESNSLLTGTIDARLPYPLYAAPSTGLLKDRAINTTSLASVTVPDSFTDLLVRATVASSLSVTMPEAIATKYGDTFPGEAGEYLITITKTGAAEAYVRTIKLEVANA